MERSRLLALLCFYPLCPWCINLDSSINTARSFVLRPRPDHLRRLVLFHRMRDPPGAPAESEQQVRGSAREAKGAAQEDQSHVDGGKVVNRRVIHGSSPGRRGRGGSRVHHEGDETTAARIAVGVKRMTEAWNGVASSSP